MGARWGPMHDFPGSHTARLGKVKGPGYSKKYSLITALLGCNSNYSSSSPRRPPPHHHHHSSCLLIFSVGTPNGGLQSTILAASMHLYPYARSTSTHFPPGGHTSKERTISGFRLEEAEEVEAAAEEVVAAAEAEEVVVETAAKISMENRDSLGVVGSFFRKSRRVVQPIAFL